MIYLKWWKTELQKEGTVHPLCSPVKAVHVQFGRKEEKVEDNKEIRYLSLLLTLETILDKKVLHKVHQLIPEHLLHNSLYALL